MAELDYAFLADFAQVSEGKITAVGASYTHVGVESFPTMFSTTVAGRVRTTKGADPFELKIKVIPPNEEYDIEVAGLLAPPDDARPYGEDKLGVLFAFDAHFPLPAKGLYQVVVLLDGLVARRLAFDAEALNRS